VGYRLTEKPLIISPHQLGTPQLRERVVILGVYDPDNADQPLDISFKGEYTKDQNSIYTIIEKNEDPEYKISEMEERTIQLWDDFYKGIKEKVIGFPIWYDWFKKEAPKSFPAWKSEFVRKNNELYKNNKEFIDKWEKENDYLKWCNPTQRKFEWQAGESIDSLWKGLIQFRPSGIRVKRDTCFPALVAMVQIPIIGAEKRRLTVREAARLQDFPEDFIPDESKQQAYKQFGNAVNVKVIRSAAEQLFAKY
jgi:DNA (cytosine-5)-methyltransferase 1